MKTEYINLFFSPKYDGSKLIISTDEKAIEYKGFQIYHRIKSYNVGGNVFDVVWNGVCIGMYAGLNGAKGYIDGSVMEGRLAENMQRAKMLKVSQ